MLAESVAAWIAFPLVAVGVALGLALLVERLTGHPLEALRVPVGLCAGVCLTLGVFWAGGPGVVAVVVLVLPALAGLVLGWPELRRWRPGWLTFAFVAAFGLHMAPVVLSGEWTWLGYNFVNDTAVQMMLADWIPEHGMSVTEVRESTTTEAVRGYLDTQYPLGSHALYGTLAEMVPGPLPAFYQPYIALLAAATAVGLAQLARRSGLPDLAAGAAGLVAIGANLFYQYALQGNVKEVAFLMALTAAAASGRELIGSARPLAASAAPAICFAAAFEVFSVAGGAYLAALGAALAGGALLWRARASISRLAVAGVALGAGALLLALPGLAGAVKFNDIATQTFASAERQEDLGHLLRPLELIQAAGVWLTGDYRGPVPPGRDELTVALCLLVLALLVVGVLWSAIRREPGPLVLIGATAVAAAYLLPKLSPYASGKVLALASPVVVFGAALGAWAIARRSAWIGAAVATVLALGVLWSDAFAYHVVRLAPVERLKALEEVGRRAAGIGGGPVLVNEPEEFAKVFHGGAKLNVSTEALTVTHIGLRVPQGFQSLYFDLDLQTLEFLQQHPALIKRRSPDASRPPANFKLTYRNRWYELWKRRSSPRVLEHLPLQDVHTVARQPVCEEVAAMARRAGPSELLVAARAPASVMLDTVESSRSRYWTQSWQPGMVIPDTPGFARDIVRVSESGRYRAWVAGSFSRPVDAFVDGDRLGSAGGVNNLGQWLPAGQVELEPGPHRLRLRKPGGDLSPGDGYKGELGPLLLERTEAASLVRVPVSRARELCSGKWDWIERVRR